MIIDITKLQNIVDKTCDLMPKGYDACDNCPFCDTMCGLAFEEIKKIASIAYKLTEVKPTSPTMAELVDFWEDR